MATEAGISAPICETRMEGSAKREEQATKFPPNKLPKEEKNQPDQLHELPEETFEDDKNLGTASITKTSSEANHVTSCELAENPGQPVTNGTETLFLGSDHIDDQPLDNTTNSTKDTSSEKLSHDENTSAKSILDTTCTKNELQGAESSFLQENDTLLQKDATSLAKPEDSEKVMENNVNDSQVEVQGQSKTLEEVTETHAEKTGENLPIQVEDSQMKDDKCLDKENDDTSWSEVTTVPDKIIFEEEILLKKQTEKPEELLPAALDNIKQSGLGQDAETKNALKDEGFTAKPHEILGERTDETVNEVVQTEERPVVQNVLTPVSDEEIEEISMIKVEEPGEKKEEGLEKQSKGSFPNKILMKGENDEEAAIHEPRVEKEDQLKQGFTETQNNTMLEIGPQIEKPIQSFQDGSEEIRAAVSSQNMTETISLERNLTKYPREIPDDQTEEETHEVQQNISNKGENSIQVGGLKMEVEEHFKESEKPSFLETCNNDSIENEELIRSKLLDKEEDKESILMMEEAQKEMAAESLHAACENVNDGTKNSFDVLTLENFPPAENHVKGILENVEAANSVTTTAELSEENLRTCLQNVEVKESSDNAKEEAITFLKSEPLDDMKSHEVAADEVKPEASKPNDDVTEHKIVNEEVSNGKSPVLPGTKESETRFAENLLSTTLIDTSTKEISLKEVRLDDKTNYAEDMDNPAEKLRHKEENSAETLTGAMSDKYELQDLMDNDMTERQEEVRSQSKTLKENSESHSNPTATDKSGENSPIQVEEYLGKENDKSTLTEATRDYINHDASTVTANVKYEEEVALQKEEMVKPEELLHAAFNDDKGEDMEVNCSSKEGSDTTEAQELLSIVTEERAANVIASKEETFENISIAVSSEETGENSKTEVDDSLVKHEECFEKESTESSTSKTPVKDDSFHELKVENEENMMLKVETQTEKHAELLNDASEDIETAVLSQDMEKTIHLEQNARADPESNPDDQIENQTRDVEKVETLENIETPEENSVIQVNAAEMELEEHFDDTEEPSLTETCNRDAIFLEDEKTQESTILTEEAKEKTPVESLGEKIKAFLSSPYTDDKSTESLQEQSAATIVPSEEDAEENSPIQHLEQDSKIQSLENAALLETMHEAETGDRDLQKEELLCSEKNTESTSLKKEVKMDAEQYSHQATGSIEPSSLNEDTDTTCFLAEESHPANQHELLDERTEDRTADTVDRKEENVEDVPTTVSSEQTGGSLMISDTESVVSHEPKIECLENEIFNLSLNEATRDYIKDDPSAVTNNVKSEEEIALQKPDESLHAVVDDNKTSALREDTETKFVPQYGSPTEEPLEKLSDEIGERAADEFVKEEISEVQNISIAVSDKETEAENSQVKHKNCFEKESTESYISKATVKDDYEELNVENEENSFLNIEAQTEKHVESIRDAFEDIGMAVSSQNIEQKLRADPRENLDDQIENQTVDVDKCETLEQNIAKSEENSVTQLNGSEMELEEQLNNSKKPSFTETSYNDAVKDEGLRRSILSENEEYKENTLLKEEAQEEKLVDSLYVAHEEIKVSALSPCIDDKGIESLDSQSAATFVLDEGTDETSSMQHLTEHGEKPSLAIVDLPERIREAEIRSGEIQKEELFCSAKNVGSTLLKKEEHMEEHVEHLQQAQEAAEPSNSNQDTDTTGYTVEECLDANQLELLGDRTEKRIDVAIDAKEETVEDVPKATSSEKTGANSLSGDTQSIVSHEAKVEEVPMATPSEQTEGNSLICDAESIVSDEPNVQSKSDLCENTLLGVEAETEKPVQTTTKNIAPEDVKTPGLSQNTDGTYPVDEQPLDANLNTTLFHKIEATEMDTEIKETPENAATFISNDETTKNVLIQVDGSQHKQEESEKQCSIEILTMDIKDLDDDKSIITNKLKDDDEDLSKAEFFQYEGDRDCTLLKEEAREEKPVESLHTSPGYYNSLEKEAQDEKSIECMHITPKDALNQNTETEKKIADEVEPVESLHVLKDEKPFGQGIEVAKENNDQLLTQDREVENKVELEKPVESFHALDGDKSLSQIIEVAKEEEKEDAFHGDDNALRQNIGVANDEIKKEDEHVLALHVASEDKALGRDNEVVKEETDEERITKTMHVPHVENKASHQVVDVENEDAELKLLESLHVTCENANSLGQDTKLSKEDNFVMPFPVACEEENFLSQESNIAKAETEDMFVKSLDVASEDDKSSGNKIEVTGKENLVETLSVTPEDEVLSQDTLIVKDEGVEENPIPTTHIVPEHDIALCKDMDVVKEEINVHTTPKDDEALCQDKEVINQKTEEDNSECVNMAPRDDKPLSQDMEATTKEVDEQNHAEFFYVLLEKDNEPNKDNTPANEDAAEQLIESSHIASKNDSDFISAKEDEENIVTSHQAPEHKSKEMKEGVNDVAFQPKVQEEPETAKKDNGTDIPVIDNQYSDTPHSIDTEVTAHKSVESVPETVEMEDKNTCDNIGTVHDGQKIAESYEKEEIIYNQSEDREFTSTQITHESCGEVTNTAENSATEVKEMMQCEDDKKIIELATEEKGKDVQYFTNLETEGPDATEEVVVSISEDSYCNEKELSSTKLSEEAQVSHGKSLDVASLVSEASEEKSDHNNVGETGCKEGTEVKKLELEEESTTISTKENLEMCGASMEASEITQDMPKLELCQAAVKETALETKEITTKEIGSDFLPREAALSEDQSTTERKFHMGKTESLQNEEAEIEKEDEEKVSEHKKLLECSSGTPIMVEAEGKDLPEPSDEIYSSKVVKDEDDNAIKVTTSDNSQCKEILVPTRLEEVRDFMSQEQNCNVILEAEEATLTEKKVETTPAEIKQDVESEEAPKAATNEGTETVADVSREKIHEEDQDTENNHIGYCKEETIQGSCHKNEANQGEDEFEFIINRYEDKEVKNSDIEFLEDRDNKATVDSVDSFVVNAAGQELKEKPNEDAALDIEPSEMTQKTMDDCEINGGYTDTTTMVQQDDDEIKHDIPECLVGKESEKWDKKDENCTSDKVDLNDEKTVMLEAEKSDEEKTDTLVRLTGDDSKKTCIEAANFETPVDEQVELEVSYTENVNNDSSICDKNILVTETKDSKESPSLAETETLKTSKQEESNCENEEEIRNDPTEEIEKSEPAEVQGPSLSDLIHKAPVKETSTCGEEVKQEKTHEEEHEKSKTDKEKDDEEECGEHHKSDSSSEAPVMVEAGDADVKVAHKKSHNLLSGVGTKVKHSIAKVKKAITGKSSHPKPSSPK